MKVLLIITLTALFLVGCSQEQPKQSGKVEKEAPSEKTLLQKADPVGEYGKPISLKEETEVSKILVHPEAYEGKAVLVSGTIVDVCPKRGCWIDLAGKDDYQKIRVKVKDGEIVFPLSARGNHAQVQGIVERLELSVKQARRWKAHQAEEHGEVFDTTSITQPLTIWRIKGVGAKIKG